MSLDINSLSVVSYANGFTIWHYESSDTCPKKSSNEGSGKDEDTSEEKVAAAEGYFDRAADMLRGGDLILWVTSNTEAKRLSMFTVYQSRNGRVDYLPLILQ